MRNVGDRIGAIFGADGKVVEFLGWGVYSEDEVPTPEAAGAIAETMREFGLVNPKLTLDNGDVVWGCECWWGPEHSVRDQLALLEFKGYEVRQVRIADVRARWKVNHG